MIFCFDIDGVIGTNYPSSDYSLRLPYKSVIAKINKLYDEGHTIKLLTARGSASGINWEEFTHKQLAKWGLKYHELHFGKIQSSSDLVGRMK